MKMTERYLPIGWTSASLDEIRPSDSPIIYGILQPGPDVKDGIKYVRPTEISGDEIQLNQLRKTSPEIAKKYARASLQPNDLIFTIVGTIGKVALVPPELLGANITQSSARIRPDCSIIEPYYLKHSLKSPALTKQCDDFKMGTAVPRLNLEDVRKLRIPLAPLAEQKRITDKLEAVLGRVAACRARLDLVPALLKRFRQSVLASATSGRLTEEWRMMNGVNDEWEESLVQDVAEQVFDGPFGSHLKTADYTPSGVRVARLENIGWMTFLAEKEAFISPEKYKTLTRHTLKKDDVVFSSFISEETRVALLPNSWSGKAINKSDCYCVRVDQGRCLPKFLMFRLACRSTYHILGEDVHGATRPRINLGQLKGFSFALPSLPEQQEIVRCVEVLFAMADRIETRLANAQKTVERLTPATLAKAFRGELVPQDPNDEPAEELLTKLRGASASPPIRKARRAASKSS